MYDKLTTNDIDRKIVEMIECKKKIDKFDAFLPPDEAKCNLCEKDIDKCQSFGLSCISYIDTNDKIVLHYGHLGKQYDYYPWNDNKAILSDITENDVYILNRIAQRLSIKNKVIGLYVTPNVKGSNKSLFKEIKENWENTEEFLCILVYCQNGKINM